MEAGLLQKTRKTKEIEEEAEKKEKKVQKEAEKATKKATTTTQTAQKTFEKKTPLCTAFPIQKKVEKSVQAKQEPGFPLRQKIQVSKVRNYLLLSVHLTSTKATVSMYGISLKYFFFLEIPLRFLCLLQTKKTVKNT